MNPARSVIHDSIVVIWTHGIEIPDTRRPAEISNPVVSRAPGKPVVKPGSRRWPVTAPFRAPFGNHPFRMAKLNLGHVTFGREPVKSGEFPGPSSPEPGRIAVLSCELTRFGGLEWSGGSPRDDRRRELSPAELAHRPETPGRALAPARACRRLWRVPEPDLEEAQDDATRLAVQDMERAGVDIVTDGEMRRESYSNRFATALEGVDLDTPGVALDRTGHENPVPRVVGPIRRARPVEVRDVEFLRGLTDRRIKITVPGPFTMAQQAQDDHYGEDASSPSRTRRPSTRSSET